MIWHCLAEINKTYLKNGAALAVYGSPKPAYIYFNCVLITSRKNMVHIAVSGFFKKFFLNGSMLTSIFGCTTSWLYWKCFFKSLPKHIQWYPLQNVIFNIGLSLSFLILLYDLYHGRRWDIQILKKKEILKLLKQMPTGPPQSVESISSFHLKHSDSLGASSMLLTYYQSVWVVRYSICF